MRFHHLLKSLLLLSLINSAWAVPLEAEKGIVPVLNAEASYRQGLEKLTAGDLNASEQAFKESAAKDPKSAKPVLGLAEIAFRRKQPEQYATLLEQALKLEPNNASVQLSWGRYLKLGKKYSEAEQAFAKAAELDSASALPKIALGDLYQSHLGKPEAAVMAYEAALKIEPNNAAAHYALGVAQAKLGNNDLAIAGLQKASELDSSNPLPLTETARVYLLLNKPGQALDAVNKALKIDANSLDIQLLHADILLANGDSAMAEKRYSEIAIKNPSLTLPLLRLAMLQHQLSRFDEAVKSYQ